MEYIVLYQKFGGGGNNNNIKMKRKRFERDNKKMDGILKVHVTQQKSESAVVDLNHENICKSYSCRRSSISVSLLHQPNENDIINEPICNDSMTQFSSDDDSVNVLEQISNKKKLKSDRQRFSIQNFSHKSKLESKSDTQCNHIYSGHVTQVLRAAQFNSNTICPSCLYPFVEDDTLILDRYKVEILGIYSTDGVEDYSYAAKAIKPSLVNTSKILPPQPKTKTILRPINRARNYVATSTISAKKYTNQCTIHNMNSNSSIVKVSTAPIKKNVTDCKTVVLNQADGISGIPAKNSKADFSHIPLPSSVRQALRPHQMEGVDFLWQNLFVSKQGCILGDEMGLGKTLMTIACISAINRHQREKQFIVVCPSSLVTNWANEFDKWLGLASQPKRVVIREGGVDCAHQLRTYIQKTNLQMKHQSGQVLIVSYDLLRRNINEFKFVKNISIGLLIMDEGHRLKKANGSITLSALASLPTDARLCITATPIQNNLCEFFTLANFCRPGILGPNMSYFRKQFEQPIILGNKECATQDQVHDGRTKAIELESLSKCFMIRRLQKNVLKAMLPPRMEAIMFCRPSHQQCQLYQSVCKKYSCERTVEALTSLINLRKICSHPILNADSNTNGTNHIPGAEDLAVSGKFIVLDTLLKQIRTDSPSDKVVIVSNFTSVLALIESIIVKKNSYSFLRLDGTTKNRQDLIDTFNRTSSDRMFCLLLSSKAGGCGLNIVGANRLVMFDADWNPAICQQAMGRIYRPGQSKQCFVYRLFVSGTVEEVICQRQLTKGGLAVQTLDCVDQNEKIKKNTHNDLKFTDQELNDCFNLKDINTCNIKDKLGSDWLPVSDETAHDDDVLFAVATIVPQILNSIFIRKECGSQKFNFKEQLEECVPSVAGYQSDCEEYEFDF